jgi:hypothetical protein
METEIEAPESQSDNRAAECRHQRDCSALVCLVVKLVRHESLAEINIAKVQRKFRVGYVAAKKALDALTANGRLGEATPSNRWMHKVTQNAPAPAQSGGEKTSTKESNS